MKRLILVCAWLIGFAMASMAQAKYVFYFIGDEMGTNQMLAAEMYQVALQGKIGRIPLVMSQLPYSSQAATFSASYGITDSAAVPIFAIDVGAEHFTGWHDNSEIAPLIYQATRE